MNEIDPPPCRITPVRTTVVGVQHSFGDVVQNEIHIFGTFPLQLANDVGMHPHTSRCRTDSTLLQDRSGQSADHLYFRDASNRAEGGDGFRLSVSRGIGNVRHTSRKRT
jgi:hypothetical protein